MDPLDFMRIERTRKNVSKKIHKKLNQERSAEEWRDLERFMEERINGDKDKDKKEN